MSGTVADDARPVHDTFAAEGAHWLVDLHGCDAAALADLDALRALLQRAARIAGADVLSSHFHRLVARDESRAGVTGVVLLAESHVTIHTWPEHRFAALDVFLCGQTEPAHAIACIETALDPERSVVTRHARGAATTLGGVSAP